MTGATDARGHKYIDNLVYSKSTILPCVICHVQYAVGTEHHLMILKHCSVGGEIHGTTLWLVVCGAAALIVAALVTLACWIARRRNSLAHKLGKYF